MARTQRSLSLWGAYSCGRKHGVPTSREEDCVTALFRPLPIHPQPTQLTKTPPPPMASTQPVGASAPTAQPTGLASLESAAPVIPPPAGEGAPAPAPYYWEETGDAATTPPLTVVLTHNVAWLAAQLLSGVEAVGEVFSQWFGLYNLRFAAATEMRAAHEAAIEEEEMEMERRARWAEIAAGNKAEADAVAAATVLVAAAGGAKV